MLSAGEAACAGKRDVDGFGGECGIAGSGARRLIEQPLDKFLQRLETLADRFLRGRRRRFEPARGHIVETALFAADPAQAETFEIVGRGDGGRFVGGLFGERGKCLVERGVRVLRQIGNCIVGHCEVPE